MMEGQVGVAVMAPGMPLEAASQPHPGVTTTCPGSSNPNTTPEACNGSPATCQRESSASQIVPCLRDQAASCLRENNCSRAVPCLRDGGGGAGGPVSQPHGTTPLDVMERLLGDSKSSRPDSVERECSPSDGTSPDGSDASQAAAEKKPVKDGTKAKRREDKGIEHVLKALSSLETTEDKLAALCKKYTELLEEHRLLQNSNKLSQKKLSVVSREKDQLQTEQSKTVLAKGKLESLCRELQKHNKIIKDESVARAKEEEEKRKDVTNKFQATINDIQRQMGDNYEKNNKLREENVELATKLKNLIEQYELREQHIEKVFKHKDLEHQLLDAKLAQAALQMTEEKERNIRDKQELLEQAVHAQTKIEILEAQEVQLRGQVALYTEKYEEFQSTLAKSNEVFQSFKSEMDKMTKKIKKLEKETIMWRQRWENSNKALLEMAEQKTRSDKETALLNSKTQKLENLCRALQEERKKLAAKITAQNESATINGVVNSSDAVAEPTKTPPNTPEGGGSRGSPVTVGDQTVSDIPIPPNPSPHDTQDDSQSNTGTKVDGQSEGQNPEAVEAPSEKITESAEDEEAVEK